MRALPLFVNLDYRMIGRVAAIAIDFIGVHPRCERQLRALVGASVAAQISPAQMSAHREVGQSGETSESRSPTNLGKFFDFVASFYVSKTMLKRKTAFEHSHQNRARKKTMFCFSTFSVAAKS